MVFTCPHGIAYPLDDPVPCAACRAESEQGEPYGHVGSGINVPLHEVIAAQGIDGVLELARTHQGFRDALEIANAIMQEPAPRQSRWAGKLTRERPSWDAYYMQLARDAAARVTCPAGQVGCLIISPEGVPLIFGYNGAPSGLAHCDEAGCSWVSRINTQGTERRHYPRHVHAEANAIARAARVGARLDRGTLYVTQEPCADCLKLCIQAGLAAIVVGDVKDRKWYDEAAGICESVSISMREAQA